MNQFKQNTWPPWGCLGFGAGEGPHHSLAFTLENRNSETQLPLYPKTHELLLNESHYISQYEKYKIKDKRSR